MDTVISKVDCRSVERSSVKPSLQCLRAIEVALESIVGDVGGRCEASPVLVDIEEEMPHEGAARRLLESSVDGAREQLSREEFAISDFGFVCRFSKLKSQNSLVVHAVFTGDNAFPQYQVRSTLQVQDYRGAGRERKLVDAFDYFLFKKPLRIAAG